MGHGGNGTDGGNGGDGGVDGGGGDGGAVVGLAGFLVSDGGSGGGGSDGGGCGIAFGVGDRFAIHVDARQRRATWYEDCSR